MRMRQITTKSSLDKAIRRAIKSGKWLLRSDDLTYNGIGQWNTADDWDPDPCRGGGLYGQTYDRGGYIKDGNRVVFCDYAGDAVVIDSYEVKVQHARILYVGLPPQLKKVGGSLDFNGTPIADLGQLESVGGYLELSGTPIGGLGRLKTVGRTLNIADTQITDLGRLQSVGENLYLTGTPIRDLGQLESVGGHLNLCGTQIKTLGKLKTVGGSLALTGTQITDLGQLEYVGKNLYLTGTQITDVGHVRVGGSIIR